MCIIYIVIIKILPYSTRYTDHIQGTFSSPIFFYNLYQVFSDLFFPLTFQNHFHNALLHFLRDLWRIATPEAFRLFAF